MDYSVQVGDLSEKVKREVAVIASPAQLDEQTWDAVSAISAVAGHLEFISLYDVTDEIYYYPADLPVTIPCGHRVFVGVGYYNDDPYAAHSLTCMVEFLDPDGVSKGKVTVTQTIPAGGDSGMFTDTITLDKPGTWNVHAVLSD